MLWQAPRGGQAEHPLRWPGLKQSRPLAWKRMRGVREVYTTLAGANRAVITETA